jgi:hypothetical protein
MVRARSSRAKSPNEKFHYNPVKQFGKEAELGPNEETKDSEINESQKAPESEGADVELAPPFADYGRTGPEPSAEKWP